MKILFISSFRADREEGGVGTYLAEVSAGLENRGHEVEVISLDNGNIYSDCLPLAYLQKFYHPVKSRELRKKITDFDPDVVHVHQITVEQSFLLNALRGLEVPKVKTFHVFGEFCRCSYGVHENGLCDGYIESCYIADELSLKQYVFRKPLTVYRNILRRKTYDKAFTPSEDLANLANRFIDTEVLPNFVDTEKFKYSEAVGEGFLYFGRVLEKKGVGDLLQAFSKLNAEDYLTVIGTGEIQKFRDLAKELGISNGVEFKGFVTDEQLVREIQFHRFAVVPSRWREAFGLTGIESMSCGTPVIGANIGGIPDYIQNGETGFLFESENESDLLSKLKTASEMEDDKVFELGINSRETAREFSLEAHLDSLVTKYKQF